MKELVVRVGDAQKWQENYHLSFISIVLGSLVLVCSSLGKYSISGGPKMMWNLFSLNTDLFANPVQVQCK